MRTKAISTEFIPIEWIVPNKNQPGKILMKKV
jgi:hypothetical protein